VVGIGKALQVPGEAVRTCSVVLVPETVGFKTTVGILVIGPIDAETLKPVEPELEVVKFEAVTRTITCLPAPVSFRAIDRAEKLTATGTRLFSELLLPSWPKAFHPQHCKAPLSCSAQVLPQPVENDFAVVKPETVTGTRLCVVELFPSWPLPFEPQHCIVPLPKSAQVCPPPAEIDIAVETPETDAGTRLVSVLLLPSWPLLLIPQH
jgi:hypothetical protein